MDGCPVNLITKSGFCNHLSHWDLKAERELLMPLAVASATVGVLYLILLALIQSAPRSVFQAALYLHARNKLDRSHCPNGLLSDALDYRRR